LHEIQLAASISRGSCTVRPKGFASPARATDARRTFHGGLADYRGGRRSRAGGLTRSRTGDPPTRSGSCAQGSAEAPGRAGPRPTWSATLHIECENMAAEPPRRLRIRHHISYYGRRMPRRIPDTTSLRPAAYMREKSALDGDGAGALTSGRSAVNRHDSSALRRTSMLTFGRNCAAPAVRAAAARQLPALTSGRNGVRTPDVERRTSERSRTLRPGALTCGRNEWFGVAERGSLATASPGDRELPFGRTAAYFRENMRLHAGERTLTCGREGRLLAGEEALTCGRKSAYLREK
jgi:hypothetical protein